MYYYFFFLLIQKAVTRTSLADQWLRLHLPMQGMQIPSLVRELRSHMLGVREEGATKT